MLEFSMADLRRQQSELLSVRDYLDCMFAYALRNDFKMLAYFLAMSVSEADDEIRRTVDRERGQSQLEPSGRKSRRKRRQNAHAVPSKESDRRDVETV